MTLLSATGLRGGYGGADILNGADLSVGSDEIVVIVGPNGAGKSTLMRAIFGLVPVLAGSIRFDGAEIIGTPTDRLVMLGLGYVPQERNVFPSLTVSENLDMGMFAGRGANAGAHERVFEMFPALREHRKRPAGELSGGQRQMVALGRALMLRPRLLMLDEPTAGLSPKFVDEIFDRVTAIRDSGTGVLMVEQNARRSLEIADRGTVLVMGRNRFDDTGAALLANAGVAEAFLGGAPS